MISAVLRLTDGAGGLVIPLASEINHRVALGLGIEVAVPGDRRFPVCCLSTSTSPSEPYGFAFSVWVSRSFMVREVSSRRIPFTVISQVSVLLPEIAVMTALPGPVPLTSPVALFTVATEGLSLLQVKGAPPV